MIPKILDGRKIIESRWGKTKCAPWGKVRKGDSVYFKNAGEPIKARAEVRRVVSYENLTPGHVREILEKYGGNDGISISNLEQTVGWAKEKRYCTLIFLTDAKEVVPFLIDKKGFGTAAAWITISNVNKIKRAF